MRAKQFIRSLKEGMGDGDAANAIVAEVIKLIGEGHTEVSPDVITTKVSAALGRPFMLKDLVAANNSSPELQHYIDSINPTKIKFSTDILTVKNQDPAKDKAKAEAGVANMAARAASRPRLGEGADQGISKSAETKFHKKLDTLVHDTFGKRPEEVEEGWGRDRVTLPDEPALYWSSKGPLSKEYNELYAKLVPDQGPADTIEGEVLRAASKIVYRHYNDGDEFNEPSFRQLEQYIGKVSSYDDLAHKATEFALKANGNYHPNAGWDSLDVMEYGPEDYNDDYEEDDSEWYEEPEWDQDEDEVDESRIETPEYQEITFEELPIGAQFVTDPQYFHLDAAHMTKISDTHAQRAAKKIRFPEDVTVWSDEVELDEGWGYNPPRNIKREVEYEKKQKEKLAAYHAENPITPDTSKTQQRLLKIPGFKNLSAEEQGRVAGRVDGYLTRGLTFDQALVLAQKNHVEEGWESGPDERDSYEPDPDYAYDQARQEKLDIEAEKEQAKRPQQKVYTLVGRGPNMEPNYKFPGEYASQDDAIAAREKLMADPNTPNPRMIGISTHTRYLDEGRETPLRDLEDYSAKKKALQDIQMDPHTAKDKELSAEVIRRLAGLEKQKSELK